MQSSTLDAALQYLKKGWSVVPAYHVTDEGCSCLKQDCTSPGKHPRIQWGPYQTKLPTALNLERWWKSWPQANIAVITGAMSGIVVLDVDPRHGGNEALRDLGPLPDTMTVLTGGGGQHLYFQHPGGRVPNVVVGNGLDRRGDGGYVIAPPSSHASGQHYLWEVGYGPDDVNLAPLPEVVLQLAALPSQGAVDLRRDHLDPEVLIRTGIPEGARNDTLTRLAGSLAAQNPSEAHVLAQLLWVNRHLKEPLAEDEVETIGRSIIRRELAQRREREELANRITTNGAMAELSDEELRVQAKVLWDKLRVQCSDWYLLQSTQPEFILATPEQEIVFDDFLSYRQSEKKLAYHLKVELPQMKPAEWREKAFELIHCARVEVVEDTRASERVAVWLGSYARFSGGAQEYEPGARRDALNRIPILYNGRLAFKSHLLLAWLQEWQGEQQLKKPVLEALLRRAGAQNDSIRVGPKEKDRVYLFPLDQLDLGVVEDEQ